MSQSSKALTALVFISVMLIAGVAFADDVNDIKKGVAQFKFDAMSYTAEQGDGQSQFNVGLMYYNGNGVPKDYIKAAEWFKKAAAQGVSRAQYNLGVMYADGEGVPKDFAKAAEWYEKAAAQGDEDAQCNLGTLYLKGEGVPKDDVKAVEWFQKAAEQGNVAAQYNLGNKYFRGQGIPKDDVLALKWFYIAASQGDEDSIKNRDDLSSSMPKPQVYEAQKLSREWAEKNKDKE